MCIHIFEVGCEVGHILIYQSVDVFMILHISKHLIKDACFPLKVELQGSFTVQNIKY